MNTDTQGRDAAAEAIRKIHRQRPNDLRRATMLDALNLTDVQKREQHAATARAERLLRSPRDQFGGDLRKSDAPTCVQVIRDIHARGSGEDTSLGYFVQKLIANAPRPDPSLDAVKNAHRNGRLLDAAGMHSLMNPRADTPRRVGKRSVPITVNGRELFKLEVPITQDRAQADADGLADDGATRARNAADVPTQRVTVFGRVPPRSIGSSRSTVAVEDAEDKTSSGQQDASIQAIKAAWNSPMPYLR